MRLIPSPFLDPEDKRRPEPTGPSWGVQSDHKAAEFLWLLDLLVWLFQEGFKVSSGTAEWDISSYGTDCDHSEIASPVTHNLVESYF